MKKALITGITGQDGSYLAELLLSKNYIVHGTVRRTSTIERTRLKHLYNDPAIYGNRLFLHYADLDDTTTLRRVLSKVAPDEIYHLAGQSHVGMSFEIPESTCELAAMSVLRLLEMLRDLPIPPKFYHASSSEVFGKPLQIPQDEDTPFNPVTPYGCAKSFATQMVRIYKDTFGLFACNGIAYNHESPRRGENFVTRKICHAAALIKAGRLTELVLGDLSAQRDWGNAQDYVRGMWLALQHETAEDYIFATGKLQSVADVVEIAFETAGLDPQAFIRHDERFVRLSEPCCLVGNSAKAKRLLGWEASTLFKNLIREMTVAELETIQ